ncbi:MAG: DUF1643 domain-containing protein [Sarcina sp.]
MEKYKYPRFVDKKNIIKVEDSNKNRLFKLSIPLSYTGDKSVLVVTRSPRNYNEDGSSHIVSKVLKYIDSKRHEEFLDVGRVDIVFLFPVREHNEELLSIVLEENGEKYLFGNDGFYDDIGHLIKNDELIFYSMMEANYIIFAWGNMPSGIEDIGMERVKYILKAYRLIKNNSKDVKETYKVGGTSKGYPKHCLMWRETDAIYRIEV